ncbi:MAG: BamA/TamA family outer membrane protein [Myxococcota bacterium]
MSGLAVWLLLAPRAFAQEEPDEDPPMVEAPPEAPPWWVGLPVAYVRLQATDEGSLPEENFEPLLHVEAGAPLQPRDIATDIETLFQLGEFSAVDADAEPWMTTDAQGDPVTGVMLTYRLSAAPKIARVRVQGNRRFRDRAILEASGAAEGQVFYPALDGEFLASTIERWLVRQGQQDPTVHVRTTEPQPGELYLLVDVDEGRPNTLERLTFAGDLRGVATQRQLRRWVRKAGVRLGKPLAPEAVVKGQEEVRRQLGTVGGVFRRNRGYISARVQPLLLTTETGARLTYTVEPGPQLQLELHGLGYGGERLVQEALGIDHRLRITRGFLDQAPDKLETALQERGWLAAEATITREQPDPETDRLVISVELGPKHVIGRIPSVGELVAFDFTFDDPPDSAAARSKEASELQAVFDQASPDVLRRKFYTEPAMRTGAEAARQYYVDRGYLDAKLTIHEPEIHARRSPANLWRLVTGQPRHQKVTPQVEVSRGTVTTLAGLELQGAASGVDLGFFDAARAERVGAPYSPQKLDALARRVVEAHRAAGYLGVDARVQQAVVSDSERSAVIVVEPGPLIVLRSVVTRGTRITRPTFVENVVDLHPGTPVTSVDLDEVRTRLYQLGVFQSLDLRLLGDDEARDLLVTLSERKRWSLELAPGVSTDQGVRAWGRLVRRNLFGRAQQIELLGQVGFEFRSQDVRDWLLDVERPEWRAAMQYTAPRFPGRRDELVLDTVLRERRQERTWQMDRSGGGVAIEHRFGGVGRGDEGFRLRLGGRPRGPPAHRGRRRGAAPGEPWQQMLRQDDHQLPTSWRPQESLTALGIYDLRDDPVSPTRGALLSANVEYAPGIPWSFAPERQRAQFVKNEARISGYVPLGGVTLHVTAGGGHIVPIAGVPPLEDRFRLGGTGSMRGFVRDSVGPHRAAPPLDVDWPGALGPAIDYVLRDDPTRWTPTGGDTMASLSTELLIPLPAVGLTGWDGYAGELFADAGNVWLLDPQLEDLQGNDPLLAAQPFFRLGVGVGMRIAPPVGPLQFDLALNPQAAFATGDRRTLLVNEWREPAVRAHLTLGALW